MTSSLRNVTLLERPIRLAAVLSVVRAALRGRARQYEVRDLLVQLRQARADAESANLPKDEFLATLSHELRTPLTAILGWTSMLTRGQIEPARMSRAFEALDRNAQSQAQLIASHTSTVVRWSCRFPFTMRETSSTCATFRVRLPAAARIPANDRRVIHTPAQDTEIVLPGRAILVVDDDASTREVVAAALEPTGARVDLAASAAEAWARLQQQLPDLIVADLAMPVKDGLTFIRRVRHLSAAAERLSAIALSAYADKGSKDAALGAGFSAFLAKPARPEARLQLVNGLLPAV